MAARDVIRPHAGASRRRPGGGLLGAVVLAALASTACSPTVSAPPTAPVLDPVTLDDSVVIAIGQVLYVPIYSHITMVEEGRTINLTSTLSIRNTDRQHPMIIVSVDYYDTQGALVNAYLADPVELGPLASTEFVVPQNDISGGLGASFLVEWVATTALSDPVIEAIMINTQGNQGLSFLSPGRVIETLPSSGS
jgi:hypothetical protein